jgi:hypothetical protein
MGQMGNVPTAVIRNIMSPDINTVWVKAYLRAALEVDARKMRGRIATAREAVARRSKDLEGNSDHHAERHEMQLALAALTSLEGETRIWPTVDDCAVNDESTA